VKWSIYKKSTNKTITEPECAEYHGEQETFDFKNRQKLQTRGDWKGTNNEGTGGRTQTIIG